MSASVRFTVTKADEGTTEDLETGDNVQVVEETEKYVHTCNYTNNLLRS